MSVAPGLSSWVSDTAWVSDSGRGAPGRALLRDWQDGTPGGQRLLGLLDGSVQGRVQLPGLPSGCTAGPVDLVPPGFLLTPEEDGDSFLLPPLQPSCGFGRLKGKDCQESESFPHSLLSLLHAELLKWNILEDGKFVEDVPVATT